MQLRRFFRSQPRAEACRPFAPLGPPLALSWALLAYAAVAVAAGSAFAVLRIHDDYLEAMHDAHDGLQGVTAALTSATQALLDHGMGAALAGASAVRAAGGLDRLPLQVLGPALQRQLTGGSYVRSLFLEDAGRFVLAGRTRVLDGARAPDYLAGMAAAGHVWVGAPMHDPEDPARWVVPIALRARTGPAASGWAGALVSADVVLADWQARRTQMIAATAAFSALVLILTAFLSHYMRALRTRERDYNTLVDNARFAVFLLEGDRFVDANRTAALMFGLESERAAVGLTPWELSPELQPNGRTSRELARERILTAAQEGGSTFEWVHKRADSGQVFPAEVDLSSLSTDGTTLALAVVHDVTARKSAEEDLRRVTAELLRLQDEERRRIGRDLHDSTGQSLAALEIDLAQLGRDAAKLSAEGREQLEQCVRLARQCSAEIRTASYLLHPPLLDELGLASALRWLADGLRARSGLEVRLQLPERLQGVAPEEELALFRVAQEALTNVQRHSSSRSAAIRLRAEPGSLVLEIEDAGRGMPAVSLSDPASSGRFAGVGVAGMRERIRQLGGSFDVESTAAGGTLVRACIPLSGRPSAGRDAERVVA